MAPDEPAVVDFLAQSMIVQVATFSQKGVPFLTPLWFVRDRGRLYMATGQATPTVRNISTHPETVLLFDAERTPGTGRMLRMRGEATWHRRFPSSTTLIRFAMKYYLSPGGARSELSHCRKWRLRQRYYGQGEAAVIEVVPHSAEFVARPAQRG
jgi:nitroimidazol reductase NimA-like FMN-containing flavoprotein (pyridoxamine 5'-phosphate oxidase superfamily)